MPHAYPFLTPTYEEGLSNEIRDCEACHKIKRLTYTEFESIESFVQGREEPELIQGNGIHREVEWMYFGNLNDLKTGRMLYTGDVCPRDELDIRHFHRMHGEIDNVQDFLRGQIECDRRLKAYHDHGQNLYIRNGPCIKVNWQQRVTDDREMAMSYNNPWRARYMTTDNSTTGWSNYTQFNTSAGTTTTNSTAYWDVDLHEADSILRQRQWTSQVRLTNDNTYQMRSRRTLSETDLTKEGHLNLYAVKSLINKVFIPVPRKQYLKMSPEHKKLVTAKNKSEKLLKQWLSPNEYKALKNLGQLEIKDLTDPDTIYIIKRDPNERVLVQHKGKNKELWCLVANKLDMPVGDQLLTKVMMLKYDQKAFKKISVKTDFVTSKTIYDDGKSYEGKIMPINIIKRKDKIIKTRMTDVDRRVNQLVAQVHDRYESLGWDRR